MVVQSQITIKVADYPHKDVSPLLDHEDFVYIKDSKYHVKSGIAGILTKPESLKFKSFAEQVKNESTFSLPTHKLILVLHGDQAHKNSTFQPMLADKLSKLGYYVLRIDFRGLGDSEDNFDPKIGRTIEQDVEDITSVYDFAQSDACEAWLGRTLTLDTIIAHSRGVLSMFEFARSHYVPNIINLCGRFDTGGLLQKVSKLHHEWEKDNGYWCNTLRYGKWTDIWIPRNETLSAGSIDTSKFTEVDDETSILSVYCSNDTVIPITAAAEYSKLFQGRHTLEIVPNSDHNFYGLPNDPNVFDLPIRKGKVNYSYYLMEILVPHLNQESQINRFCHSHKLVRSRLNPGDLRDRWPLPFEFSHISNFRDIGGYKTKSSKQVRPGIMYRCANPDQATPEAIKYMKERLYVNKIFDLRALTEANEGGIISGFDVENLAFNNNMVLSPEEMAKHYEGMFLSSHKFPKAYEIVLRNSFPSIRRFFEYVLQGEVDEKHSVVFHCTAGKDRTGLLAMLTLGIAGVDVDTIARDYELTTIGLRTETRLIEKINNRGDQFYVMLGPDGREKARMYGLDPERMARHVLSSIYEAMRIFIDQFHQQYGSFNKFFINQLQFTQQEVDTIREYITI